MISKKQNNDNAAKSSQVVHLVSGSDAYAVEERCRSLLDDFCPPERRDFGLDTVDAEARSADEAAERVNDVRQALRTPGFLGAGKVIWLRGADWLGETQFLRSSALKQALALLVEDLQQGRCEGQILLVSASRIDGRSAFHKACKSLGRIWQCDPPSSDYRQRKEAVVAAARCLKEAGARFGNEVPAALAERVGADTGMLAQEARKLAVFAGDSKVLTLADIREVATASREVRGWDVAEALGKKEFAGALEKLRGMLAQREAGLLILTIVERHFSLLRAFRCCLDRGWLRWNPGGSRRSYPQWAINREQQAVLTAILGRDPEGMHGYRVLMLCEQAVKYSSSQLNDCRRMIVECHERMVSATSSEAGELEMLILKIAGTKV